jgi:hypothetical protein
MQFCLHGAFKVYIKTSSLQFANTQTTEKVLIQQLFFKRQPTCSSDKLQIIVLVSQMQSLNFSTVLCYNRSIHVKAK